MIAFGGLSIPPLSYWAYAPARAARAVRLVVVGLGLLLGILALTEVLRTLGLPQVFGKDFLQEYVLARSVATGVDPYQPLNLLAAQLVRGLPPGAYPFEQPTPHPATVGLLFLPFAFIDYPLAAVVWFLFELVCLTVALYVLARTAWTARPFWALPLVVLVIIGWTPIRRDLYFGQLMIAMLVLLAGGYQALRSGHSWLGGALVGVALLVKPVAWLLLPLFLLRRDWRALAGSLVTLVAGFGITTWIVGVGTMLKYFTEVIPKEYVIYRASVLNLSVPALAWRLFGSGTEPVFNAYPLVNAPQIAGVVSVVLSGLVVLIGYLAMRKELASDAAFGLSLTLSLLISPIVWDHYLVLAVIPLAIVGAYLVRRQLPDRLSYLALAAAVLLAVPVTSAWTIAQRLAGGLPQAGGSVQLPFVLTLGTFAPMLGLAALSWLLVVTARATPRRA